MPALIAPLVCPTRLVSGDFVVEVPCGSVRRPSKAFNLSRCTYSTMPKGALLALPPPQGCSQSVRLAGVATHRITEPTALSRSRTFTFFGHFRARCHEGPSPSEAFVGPARSRMFMFFSPAFCTHPRLVKRLRYTAHVGEDAAAPPQLATLGVVFRTPDKVQLPLGLSAIGCVGVGWVVLGLPGGSVRLDAICCGKRPPSSQAPPGATFASMGLMTRTWASVCPSSRSARSTGALLVLYASWSARCYFIFCIVPHVACLKFPGLVPREAPPFAIVEQVGFRSSPLEDGGRSLRLK